MAAEHRLLTALLLLAFATGCVGKGKYNEALDELAALQATYEAQSETLAEVESERDGLSSDLMECRDLLSMTTRERDDLTVRLTQAMNMLEERGEERELLLARLEELSAIQREEQERNRIYREFIARFQSQIEAGNLSVSISRGRVVIELPQDILFASGSATLGDEGTATLTEVGEVLATFEDRQFQIEGHTDNVPIATRQFPSNWELSTARALAVVRLMIEAGVSPENISAAGYGEFQPRASNEEPETRRLNRRIEIVMLPNLDLFSDSPVAGRN